MSERLMSVVATREIIHLSTSFDYPPIPCRELDWSAIDANTYDASYEGEDEDGHHWKCSPCGNGETEIKAIHDLLDKLEEQADSAAN